MSKQQLASQVKKTQQHANPSPIPSPEILHGFDQIVPGAADRILTMAEENGKHQREIEKSALSLAAAERKRGQIFSLVFSLVISICAFATCIIALIYESEGTAITIAAITIIGIVITFLAGRNKET